MTPESLLPLGFVLSEAYEVSSRLKAVGFWCLVLNLPWSVGIGFRLLWSRLLFMPSMVVLASLLSCVSSSQSDFPHDSCISQSSSNGGGVGGPRWKESVYAILGEPQRSCCCGPAWRQSAGKSCLQAASFSLPNAQSNPHYSNSSNWKIMCIFENPPQQHFHLSMIVESDQCSGINHPSGSKLASFIPRSYIVRNGDHLSSSFLNDVLGFEWH